ncbi:MotA/TolQ/ExbB proton channel family protein [Ideonella sp.]|uniref:MotA/TolQ/ExbB proton channel family protein n=1 Tax=Ideonella sp. TaxID=1929293 RepID=UPI0035B3CA7A
MSFLKLVRAPFLAASIALLGTVALAPAGAFAQDTAASAPAADAAPAAAPAAEPAVPAAGIQPEVKKEEIDNPYGLKALWEHGGWVDRITLVIMLIMSMGSWYIIFTKVWEQHKLLKSASAASQSFWTAGSVKKGAETLEEASAFRYIAEQGLKAADHHEGTLTEQIDRHTWVGMSVQRSVDNINSRLQDGLAFLATVGSTAPFVGLFGTVWGIYNALTAIGVSGQASIDKVAGPVGAALIMTAVGLAVAVPAVMGYNWLIRRNKVAMERVRAFSADLHNVLLAGKR